MIKVDKGIEMPNTKGRKMKYPFDTMQVGDSFAYPDGLTKHGVLGAAKSWAKRNKKKHQFAVRTVNGKFRLWRTK